MKALSSSSLFIALLFTAPAFASVTVGSPANGATVTSPFTLAATATACSSQSIASMGYSLDSSTSTAFVKGASLSASVSASVGSHVVHVKSWGTAGASCTANVSISVVQGTTSSTTNVVVSNPTSGASVASPFNLAAAGTLCQGQSITAMGYSLDTSTSTSTVNGTSISASVTAAAGSHTLHVKSWGKSGSACSNNVSVAVTAPAPSGPSIPSTATVTKAIQNLTTWTGQHDAGTTGTSSGTMTLVTSPALSSSARQFATSYTNYGGERYNISVAPDQTSTNFVYDTHIYIASPSSDIANIEMDLNQVMANGQTAIFGFQCDAWSHTWDYASNAGTPTSPQAHWTHSTQTCSLQKWATNVWHHVQIQYSRDTSGNVTYKAVWLDGVQQNLNVTVLSAFALGWAPSLNSNFQIDGFTSTSGSSTVYLDNFTLYAW
jgi:hypothetical protein